MIEMITTATATGTLMKKINRQETALISQPPRNGPMADATPPRPDHGPDRLTPIIGNKGGFDDGQAARREEGSTDTLQGPSCNQSRAVRRQARSDRRHHEPDGADNEDAPATQSIAERSSEQQQT